MLRSHETDDIDIFDLLFGVIHLKNEKMNWGGVTYETEPNNLNMNITLNVCVMSITKCKHGLIIYSQLIDENVIDFLSHMNIFIASILNIKK